MNGVGMLVLNESDAVAVQAFFNPTRDHCNTDT